VVVQNLFGNATIQPEVVLYYYDGPLVFLAHQHLYYFVEDGEGVTWYLVTSCSSVPDLTCIRSFFEGRPTFFVAIDHNSKVVSLEEHKFLLNLVLPELGIGLPS